MVASALKSAALVVGALAGVAVFVIVLPPGLFVSWVVKRARRALRVD